MQCEMKPCRRCGSDVTPDGIEVTQTDTGTYIARFECPECREVAETCMRHFSEDFAIADVIDDWNQRWVDPALTARIEELEQKVIYLKNAIFGLMEHISKVLDSDRRRWEKLSNKLCKGDE